MPQTMLGIVTNSGDIKTNNVRPQYLVSSHVKHGNINAIIETGTQHSWCEVLSRCSTEKIFEV